MQCLWWEEMIISADVSICSQRPLHNNLTSSCTCSRWLLQHSSFYSVDGMLCSCPSCATLLSIVPEHIDPQSQSLTCSTPGVVSSANCHLSYLLYLPKQVMTRHGFSSCVNHPPKCNASHFSVLRIQLGCLNSCKNKGKTSSLQSFSSSHPLLAGTNFSCHSSNFSPHWKDAACPIFTPPCFSEILQCSTNIFCLRWFMGLEGSWGLWLLEFSLFSSCPKIHTDLRNLCCSTYQPVICSKMCHQGLPITP